MLVSEIPELPFKVYCQSNFAELSQADILEGQVLWIDKPLHWTSFQAVNKLKYFIQKKYGLKKFKIGHAGTLDPLATGVLIICTGKKTKEITEYQEEKKEYTGVIRLGATTPSFDLETEINQTFPVEHINSDLIKDCAQNFIGEIWQTPPVFSAVKVDGKRAYKSARQGIEVEIKQRKISIYEFEIGSENFPDITFRVLCSKGTYIRTLANDVGIWLQSGAHLTALRRTKIGKIELS